MSREPGRELHRLGGTRRSSSRKTLVTRGSLPSPDLYVTPFVTSEHEPSSTSTVPTFPPSLSGSITMSPPTRPGQLVLALGKDGSEFNPRMSAITRLRLSTRRTFTMPPGLGAYRHNNNVVAAGFRTVPAFVPLWAASRGTRLGHRTPANVAGLEAGLAPAPPLQLPPAQPMARRTIARPNHAKNLNTSLLSH
jgi:hypothetical protein